MKWPWRRKKKWFVVWSKKLDVSPRTFVGFESKVYTSKENPGNGELVYYANFKEYTLVFYKEVK